MSATTQKLLAYQPNGQLAWTFQQAGLDLYGVACVSAQEKIIIGGGGYSMLQFSSAGQLEWRYDTEGKGVGGEAAAVDGRSNSYIMMQHDGLYCLDPTGKLAWKCDTNQEVVNNCPVIYGDHGVLVPGFERVCLVSYSGKLLWEYAPGAPIYCRMLCLTARDEVLFADDNGTLHCLDAAGKLCWSRGGFTYPGALISTVKDDLAYLLCDSRLVVISTNTGEEFGSTALPASGLGGSLSARDDGVLVATLAGGIVAAFKEASSSQ